MAVKPCPKKERLENNYELNFLPLLGTYSSPHVEANSLLHSDSFAPPTIIREALKVSLPHFSDQETEAQTSEASCLRSPS